MKKQIVFGTIENQGDDFLKYSRSLSVEERLRYLQQLKKRAYGEKYDEQFQAQNKKMKGKIKTFPQQKNESLSDYFSRLNQFMRNGHL